jgi:hypothetical protein
VGIDRAAMRAANGEVNVDSPFRRSHVQPCFHQVFVERRSCAVRIRVKWNQSFGECTITQTTGAKQTIGDSAPVVPLLEIAYVKTFSPERVS